MPIKPAGGYGVPSLGALAYYVSIVAPVTYRMVTLHLVVLATLALSDELAPTWKSTLVLWYAVQPLAVVVFMAHFLSLGLPLCSDVRVLSASMGMASSLSLYLSLSSLSLSLCVCVSFSVSLVFLYSLCLYHIPNPVPMCLSPPLSRLSLGTGRLSHAFRSTSSWKTRT